MNSKAIALIPTALPAYVSFLCEFMPRRLCSSLACTLRSLIAAASSGVISLVVFTT